MSQQAIDVAPVASPCEIFYLGTVGYLHSCRLQEGLARARAAGEIPDTILFLQHPPVFTIGLSGYEPGHILVPQEILAQEGVEIHHTRRGGGITYHGPGQLACYPIFDLKGKGLTVRQYIRGLEEVVIQTLARFDLLATRSPVAGIYVDGKEICAIGIFVSGDITMHGFALNITTNLKHFSYIVPCGVMGKGVTSLARILSYELPVQALVEPLLNSFRSVFNLDTALRPPELLREYYEK